MILALNLIKMKLFVFLVILLPISLFSQVSIQSITVENQTNPIGIGVSNPRFSWKLSSINRNETQSAYAIQVYQGKKQVWNTGKVHSSASIFIPYAGERLQSNAAYTVKVQVWNGDGKPSKSSSASFLTAFLTKEDWKAKWITSGLPGDTVNGKVPVFKHQFNLAKKVQSARVFVTSKGAYEANLNGVRVGDSYLTPGWTSYNKHLQYQVYDVTNQVKHGANEIQVQLASGWFRTRLGWQNNQNYYGSQTSLLWQLEVNYTDGTAQTVISDGSWQVGFGNIVSSEIYDGEHQDARVGWKAQGQAMEVAGNFDVLTAQINEPIKKQETLAVKRVLTSPKGFQILDFGQNIVGWVKLKVKGSKGQKIVLRHVEMLDKKGEPYFDNLRSAKALATYELNGEEQEVEPHFTFFGFRYVQVEGIQVNPSDYQAIALHSAMTATGSFETSNPLLNQLQSNIRWGQKGNFLDVPTDCPQRDERLGWTGDAEVFSRTASFNFNVNQFFAKWLKDVKADQFPNGAVPHVIPDILNKPNAGPESQHGAAGWSDASIIIPYNMYTTYGDKQILENQYESMKAYLNYVRSVAKNDLWNTGFQFADWLSYRVDDSKGMIGQKSAVTDNYLVAQCFYAYNTELMIKTARILGKTEDYKEWEKLQDRIKLQFQKEFMTANGRLISDTQTAYILALQFDMIPGNLRQAALERLVNNIKSYNYHLTTGFLGTPFLNPVLTRFGRNDVAYSLLLQESYPSWLYPVKVHGATTIWERWDSMKPDSTFQDPSMTSFNHYAYGAIGDWMYRTIGGIDTEEFDGAGYKQIVIKPELGGKLTYAKTSLDTPYGKVSTDWAVNSTGFTLKVEVPVNTTATVILPSFGSNKRIKDGVEMPGERVRIGSGSYTFTIN